MSWLSLSHTLLFSTSYCLCLLKLVLNGCIRGYVLVLPKCTGPIELSLMRKWGDVSHPMFQITLSLVLKVAQTQVQSNTNPAMRQLPFFPPLYKFLCYIHFSRRPYPPHTSKEQTYMQTKQSHINNVNNSSSSHNSS